MEGGNTERHLTRSVLSGLRAGGRSAGHGGTLKGERAMDIDMVYDARLRSSARLWPKPADDERPAFDWLTHVDVEFDQNRDAVTVRVHTRDGWQEVAMYRVRPGTTDVTPWCQTCRRAVRLSNGHWWHNGSRHVGHDAIPAPLAGRIVMRVPDDSMALSSVIVGGIRQQQSAVLPLRHGLLLVGDI